MSHLSLYRLYRPKTFKEVIGQELITQSLMNAINTSRVVHAYIFAGSKGTGKTSIAKIFAKAINCLSPINGDACEQCENCKLANANQAIDIIELDAASNNGIDDVRHIIETAQFLPTILNKKVYIIDEAHMLTTSAWNALLKIIEEAPKHVIFIFATTELHKIPSTISSRCQMYLFNRLNNLELAKLVQDVCLKQQIKMDDKAIEKVVNLADGSARDVLSIVEQLAIFSNNEIDLEKVNKVFGLIDDALKIDFIKTLISGNTKQLINLLDQYVLLGANLSQLTHDLISILIDKLIYSQTNDISILKILTENNVNTFNLDNNKLIQIINVWQEAYANIKNSSDSRFYFEFAIFKCLKIIDIPFKNEVPTTSISTELKEVKLISQELPPLSEVVIEKEVQIQPKKEEQKSEVISETFNLKQIFFGIASNNTRDLKQRYAAKFEELKVHSSSKLAALVKPATKLITASNNGSIIVFDDEVDVVLFNEFIKTYDGLMEINKFFGKLIYFIGITKEQLSTFTNEYLLLQKSGERFNEPDVSVLEKIIRNKNSITQLAFDIFNK